MIIILNVNGLNIPIKSQVASVSKNPRNIQSIQENHFKCTSQMQPKERQKTCYTDISYKKAGLAVLVSGREDNRKTLLEITREFYFFSFRFNNLHKRVLND